MRTCWRSAAVVGLVAVVGAMAVASAGTPKLVFGQASWDFGKVWQEEKPAIDLVVRNEGDAELVLSEVRTTCGCTVAQPEKKNIPPGESTRIHVQFDTVGKQDRVTSKVIVVSNDPRVGRELGNADPDPRPGEAHFPVEGFVKRAVTRSPLGGLVVRGLGGKPGHSGVVRLENQLEEPMKLELKSNDIKEMKIDVKELIPGKLYEVIGTTNCEMKPGQVRGDIIFNTGLSREAQFQIPARIQIMASVEASPPAMFFLKPGGKPVPRKLSLHCYAADGVTGFRVTGYECNDKNVKVEIGPTRAPEPWMSQMAPPITAVVDVNVVIPPASQLPPEGALIKFKTTDKECPVVEMLATVNKPDFEARMYGRTVSGKPAEPD